MTVLNTRVLVVDDEESMRYTLKKFLEGEGYAIDTASGLNEARGLVSQHDYDVAVVDRILPAREDGLELVRHLRQCQPSCQSVLISAYPTFDSAAESLHYSTSAYLTKPVTRDEIQVVVRQAAQRVQVQKNAIHQQNLLEMLFDLARGMNHDFNNLLQIISGNCELLKRSGSLQVTEQTKIERIHEAAKIGMDQVARLMELGRESGQHLEPVDMNELVLEIKDLLEDNLLKGVNVELNLAAARPMVQADPPLLQQSLINLLKNAREALDARSESEGGEGTIRVETEDVPGLGSSAAGTASSGILLRIMDNGIGMDATTRERLFEPLYTTKASERSSKRGLGLAMAYQTVNRLGGEIRVSSRQNAGTTFEITLPTLKEQ